MLERTCEKVENEKDLWLVKCQIEKTDSAFFSGNESVHEESV